MGGWMVDEWMGRLYLVWRVEEMNIDIMPLYPDLKYNLDLICI